MPRRQTGQPHGFTRFGLSWLVSAAGPLVVCGLAAAAGIPAEQLAEHPHVGLTVHPAIAYPTRPPHDAVATLIGRLADGSAHLSFDEDTGYLRSVLAALDLRVESQMLVMSKTGIQGLHTGPSNPRAMYFNDAVTVGYIRGAPMLEFAAVDPEQGVAFYTLDQKLQATPAIERRHSCLTCHQGFSTLHVPGMLVRSMFVAPDGLPIGQFGTYDPDDRTLFRQRWGGWYVTGTHGAMRHMGNAIVDNIAERDRAISERTLNRTSLDGAFEPRGYLAMQSDIVALMVFQHQVHLTNLLTRVGWEFRAAAYDRRLDVMTGPLRDAVNEIVDSLLFVGEQPLTAPIAGTSGFAEIFAAQGPTDSRGRSLHQLDLQRRLLRYPCSYMIYSAAFTALPSDARQALYGRVWEILSGRESGPRYAALAASDRRAIAEILRGTLHDLPDSFRDTDGIH